MSDFFFDFGFPFLDEPFFFAIVPSCDMVRASRALRRAARG
jgi:hypothetical protein